MMTEATTILAPDPKTGGMYTIYDIIIYHMGSFIFSLTLMIKNNILL